MTPSTEPRLVLRAAVSRLRVTAVGCSQSGADDGAIFLGPRVCWAAGLAEFEQIEVCNLTRAQRFLGHLRLGREGEVRMAQSPSPLLQPGDFVKIAAYSWLSARAMGTHLATFARVDEQNRPTEFRQVKPRAVDLDPFSFPPLPGIEVVVDLTVSVPLEVTD